MSCTLSFNCDNLRQQQLGQEGSYLMLCEKQQCDNVNLFLALYKVKQMKQKQRSQGTPHPQQKMFSIA
jgi:hypothetical protein